MTYQNNIDSATELLGAPCHADTLRNRAKWLSAVQSIVVERSDRDALLAGADALEAIDRVNNALRNIARVKSDSEDARDRGEDAEWHEATADTLEYVIDLLTESLEGETE